MKRMRACRRKVQHLLSLLDFELSSLGLGVNRLLSTCLVCCSCRLALFGVFLHRGVLHLVQHLLLGFQHLLQLCLIFFLHRLEKTLHHELVLLRLHHTCMLRYLAKGRSNKATTLRLDLRSCGKSRRVYLVPVSQFLISKLIRTQGGNPGLICAARAEVMSAGLEYHQVTIARPTIASHAQQHLHPSLSLLRSQWHQLTCSDILCSNFCIFSMPLTDLH